MFQQNQQGAGHGGGAAVLSLEAAFAGPLRHRPHSLGPRSFGLADHRNSISRLEAQVAELDLVVDLGARIGTREWWRGLATCFALCGTALAFTPSFKPLPGTTEAALPEAHWEEARVIGIAPIAYGADTGRRMAATDLVQPLADVPERPSVELTATIGQGDGFARVLERAGVAHVEAVKIAGMVAGAIPLDQLKAGTRMNIVLGRRKTKAEARPLDQLGFRAAFDLSLAVERANGALTLRRIPIAVDHTPLRIQGLVGSSLYRSARAAGAPAKAVETYLKAIAQQLAVNRDISSADRFDLIIEHRRAETGEVEVGPLLYAGLDRANKKQTRMLKWEQDGRTTWFEASGVGERKGSMRAPVIGRMSSGFGMRRHPILGFSRFHKGLDFAAPYGAPIVAAADGVVSYAGWHGGHGKYIKLTHNGGMATGYAHMSRFAVSPGTRVSQGQVIGYVGSTGLSTGPHLHYEVYRGGAAINPKTISFITQAQLAGAELARFRARLGQLLSVHVGAAGSAQAKVEDAKVPVAKPARTADAAKLARRG